MTSPKSLRNAKTKRDKFKSLCNAKIKHGKFKSKKISVIGDEDHSCLSSEGRSNFSFYAQVQILNFSHKLYFVLWQKEIVCNSEKSRLTTEEIIKD